VQLSLEPRGTIGGYRWTGGRIKRRVNVRHLSTDRHRHGLTSLTPYLTMHTHASDRPWTSRFISNI